MATVWIVVVGRRSFFGGPVSSLMARRSITSMTINSVTTRSKYHEVYRDGVFQGASNGGSFLQTDLRDGIDYAYEVIALDSNGNSLVAAQLTVNTADRPIPGVETAFTLGLDSRTYADTVAELVWLAPNRAESYEVFRNGSLYRSLDSGDYKSLYETDLEHGVDYVYRVVAYDGCDELIIEQSHTLNTGDGVTPAQQQSERLVIKSSIFSSETAEISWNGVQGASRYDIYDNEVFITNTDGRSLFIDDLVPGIDRKFLVVAFDADDFGTAG